MKLHTENSTVQAWTLYLSTGKAARALGVNADAIRALCSAGSISAEVTGGGQWRIPAVEVERLKRDGLPPVPKPLPGQSRRTPPAPVPPATPVSDAHGTLLADPSEETVAAADEVVRLENEVRALGLKRQKEEALDWFRQREEEEGTAAAEDAELEVTQNAEDQERERRLEMQDRWVRYALASVPWEAQGHVELALHAKVKSVLASVDAEESEFVIRRLVDGVVASVLRPWRRRTEVSQVIAEAVGGLPLGACGFGTPTPWGERAGAAARSAVDRLPPDATIQEIEAAAVGAAQVVAEEFAAHKAQEADAAAPEHLLRWLPLELKDYSDAGRELAMKAVTKAFAALPVGTPREKLVAARDAALAPWRAALVEHREAQRLRSEAERKKQWAALEAQLRPAPSVQVHRPPTVNRPPAPRVR